MIVLKCIQINQFDSVFMAMIFLIQIFATFQIWVGKKMVFAQIGQNLFCSIYSHNKYC